MIICTPVFKFRMLIAVSGICMFDKILSGECSRHTELEVNFSFFLFCIRESSTKLRALLPFTLGIVY